MSASKVVYKGDGDNEFFVIANEGMVTKWKSDKTVPLVDVVQSFDVFTSNTGGSTGEAIRPPKGILESTFGTAKEEDIVKKILESGEEKGINPRHYPSIYRKL